MTNLKVGVGAAPNDNTGDPLRTAFRKLNIAGEVLSATTTAEPGSPSQDDLYIVPASATGTNWAGQDDDLAWYDGSAWVFTAPFEGMRVWAQDTPAFWVYTAGAWSNSAIGGAIEGQSDGVQVVSAATVINFLNGTVTDVGGVLTVDLAGTGGGGIDIGTGLGTELIEVVDFSAANSDLHDILDVDQYDEIHVMGVGLTCANGYVDARVSTNGGSTFLSGGTDYRHAFNSGGVEGTADRSAWQVTSNAAASPQGFYAKFRNMKVSAPVFYEGDVLEDSSSAIQFRFTGRTATTDVVDAIRIYNDNATDFTAGTLYVIGVKYAANLFPNAGGLKEVASFDLSVDTLDAGNEAEITGENLDQYDELWIEVNDGASSSDHIGVQVSPDNGVTWRNAGTDYRAALIPPGSVSGSTIDREFMGLTGQGNTSILGTGIMRHMADPNHPTTLVSKGGAESGTNLEYSWRSAQTANETINAIRFVSNLGNAFTAGSIKVWGIKYGSGKLSLGTEISASRNLNDADMSGNRYYDVDASAGDVTITIPDTLVGTEPVSFELTDATNDLIFAAGGTTVINTSGSLTVSTQYTVVTLVPKGGNVYTLVGS